MKKNISFQRSKKTIKEKGKIKRLRYQIGVLEGNNNARCIYS